MGPSWILGLPNSAWIFFIGYGLNGFSQGFLFVPIIPEVIDAIYYQYDLQEGVDEYVDAVINDKAAGLYGSFYSFGVIIAPLLGSSIFQFLEEDW